MRYIQISLILLLPLLLIAQNPERFQEEYAAFDRQDSIALSHGEDLQVDHLFVGSSSVRFWLTLAADYPDIELINRGFGGSHMSDLWTMREDLIYRYAPEKIYIYEGDNDIADGEAPDDILAESQSLVDDILSHLPSAQIYFIAAKPSVLRWEFEKEYVEFNNGLDQLAQSQAQVHFIDVWTPMLSEDGKVITDIFIHDNLHMNQKGYDIWRKVVAQYVR